MRTMSRIALLLALTAFVSAQDTRPEETKKPGPSLKVGDPAPALKATKWLQGAEVKEFAPGQVYVVEFWATWCGPCIVMMPHLSDLQSDYKGKGVTFIGYSSKDPSNTQEKVEAFLEKRGPKLKYTFAYSDDRDTYNAWMKAAGRGGIPCSFVVDRNGKIAYIGHPMYLDVVLPKVAAGTWKIDEDKATLDKIEEEVNTVFKSFRGEPEASLKAVADFEKAHPELAGIPYFTGPKLNLFLTGKDTAGARKMVEAVIAKALKQEDPLPLRTVSTALRGPLAKDDKELLALSLKAAEAFLQVSGDKDASALYLVAEAQFALGDKARARDYGARALEAADKEPRMKATIAAGIKKYEEPK